VGGGGGGGDGIPVQTSEALTSLQAAVSVLSDPRNAFNETDLGVITAAQERLAAVLHRGTAQHPKSTSVAPLRALEKLYEEGLVHERFTRVLEQAVTNVPKDKSLDVDNLTAALQTFSAKVAGNSAKFVVDAIVDGSEEALRRRDIGCDTPFSGSIYDALREVDLKRLHDFHLCLKDGCNIITSDRKDHLSKFHLAEEDIEKNFRHPTLEDVVHKGKEFWRRFSSNSEKMKRYAAHGITEDDAVSLYYYTLELEIYQDMNKGQREDRKELIARFMPLTYLIVNAMRKLPKHPLSDSQLYRAINRDVRKDYEMTQFIRWHAFSSTTADSVVVKDFLKSQAEGSFGTIFLVRSSTGVRIEDFSEFPREREVLLFPGTLLNVVGEVPEGVKELLQSQMASISPRYLLSSCGMPLRMTLRRRRLSPRTLSWLLNGNCDSGVTCTRTAKLCSGRSSRYERKA